jgi:pSer/pThr/pTyr-binding forkhead associated (FHA) protein
VKDDYILFDVGSTGGTYVNSNRIEQHTLRPGDVISLAGYSMVFASELENPKDPKQEITSELRCTDEGD